jgi:hypothetical protein
MCPFRWELGWIPKEEVTESIECVVHTQCDLHRYVAKIIFTYILGYKVDVGHMEAVNLISSSKYSEKQIVCRSFTRPRHSKPRVIGLPCSNLTDAREF